MAVILTPGQAGDNPQRLPLLDNIHDIDIDIDVDADGQRVRVERAIADKAHAHPSTRAALRQRRIKATLPEHVDRIDRRSANGSAGGRPPTFDPDLYNLRNVVERCFNRLKQFRGLATRFAKRAAYHRAEIVLASIVLHLRRRSAEHAPGGSNRPGASTRSGGHRCAPPDPRWRPNRPERAPVPLQTTRGANPVGAAGTRGPAAARSHRHAGDEDAGERACAARRSTRLVRCRKPSGTGNRKLEIDPKQPVAALPHGISTSDDPHRTCFERLVEGPGSRPRFEGPGSRAQCPSPGGLEAEDSGRPGDSAIGAEAEAAVVTSVSPEEPEAAPRPVPLRS